jgi:Fructosamine kinase
MTVQPNGWRDDWPSFYVERRVRVHLADPKVPKPLRQRIDRACDGSLPAPLRPRPPASLTHGDLWAANLVQGRWLVDPAVSFADRELELVYMQLSNSLSAELLDAYLAAWPPDPSYEQRRPALQLHTFLNNNIRHFGVGPVRAPDRGGLGHLRLVSRPGAVAMMLSGSVQHRAASSCTSRGVLPDICQRRRLTKPGAASLDFASPTPFTCDDVM